MARRSSGHNHIPVACREKTDEIILRLWPYLTHVEKECHVRHLNCVLEVTIVHDDDWALASKLQSDLLNGVCGSPLNQLSNFGRPGEGYLVHVRVGRDSGAGCG